MGDSQPTQPPFSVAKGISRQFPIPACSLKGEDLRRLFKILEKRAQEAAAYSLGVLQQQPGQTEEQFKQLKENLSALLKLVVIVNSTSGEWTASSSEESLSDASLPDSISSVVLDSAFLFRGQLKVEPQNSFKVVVDFSRTHILDLTNLWFAGGADGSSVAISGTNDVWVKAVHDDLQHFFRERSTLRGWLYSRYTYDALLWLLGIPMALAGVYRVDKWVKLDLNLPASLHVLLYVVLFMLFLLIFRFVFNYAKWAFPKIETPNMRGWPAMHRSLLLIIWTSILSLVIESIARILGSVF